MFDELMATLIDFSKFAMNRLKIDKLTKADLENPEGDRCPFDLSKPLSLKGHPGHLTVAAEYFFNNNLEYLKSTDSERKYSTSITKTKAARYEFKGIEDMIPKQWSVAKILSVVSVKDKKLHGYGYLEEIMVRRAYRQLYIFKEGNFVDLHLNDIEDMLLLLVQHKLFHLDSYVIIDFMVALHGMLKSVHDILHHKLLNFILGYNKDMPRRKWSATDQRHSGLMVDLIDKKLLERRIIWNLERLVGARKLEMDYKLMQCTV
ncbi:hypothetical protein Tco_1299769 [Tanacetum coccineum]